MLRTRRTSCVELPLFMCRKSPSRKVCPFQVKVFSVPMRRGLWAVKGACTVGAFGVDVEEWVQLVYIEFS